MDSSKQVRVLILNDGEFKDSTLYRLQRGWCVHFMLGPTLVSKDVKVFCNHPMPGKARLEPNFFTLEWVNNAATLGDRSDAFAAIDICKAGTFQYHFKVGEKLSGSGYFVVDPILRVGSDDRVLPMDSICMHTILPKSLGSFSDWKKRIEVSYKTGYNVIHLTPVQKLGISNSSYCIAEQLKLNPAFSVGETSDVKWTDLGKFVDVLKNEWSMLTMTDVVWNHTAKNSEWLKEYPQCAFNLVNSPHLRPAYVLDRALYYVALDVGKGSYIDDAVPKIISCEEDLTALEKILSNKIIPELKLWEFFQVDVECILHQFDAAVGELKCIEENRKFSETISIIQDMQFRRLKSTIDINVAVCQFYQSLESHDMNVARQNLENTLAWLNKMKKREVEEDMISAVKNIISTIRYERLDEKGPKKVSVSAVSPLVTEYFYHSFPDKGWQKDEQAISNKNHAQYIMAHNGWVMGADPMKNFAEYPTKTYFRRELVCWGDSVKLNYGAKPEDCPVLWQRMKQYTEMTAHYFHGIRIDNCHSTPIHVAEYMLSAARKIRPDLYVFAELFTGSEALDNIFVNKLGINSLIREGLVAWDSQELGRLVYRYGGEPVASFVQPNTRPLVPSLAHALLFDVTHDNESAIKQRTHLDPLPFSALVSMACCATGSNRGHDELVPHHIHVVNEKRNYAQWSDNADDNTKGMVGGRSGILRERRVLNLLHQTMAINGFTQVFVDQRDSDVVVVTRHNPITHQSYVLVAHTAFVNTTQRQVAPLTVEGHIESIAFEAKPQDDDKNFDQLLSSFAQYPDVINGLTGVNIHSDCDVSLNQSSCCVIECDPENKNAQKIVFTDFPPGSVLVFRMKLMESAEANAIKVRSIVKKLIDNQDIEFKTALASLNLEDLNRVLFRCDEEEKSDGFGIGVYNFQGWDSLKYCGLVGIMSVMAKIRAHNDLGHPVCKNLREGNWLMDYISSRLQKHGGTKRLGLWFSSVFDHVSKLPRYLIPAYFDMTLVLPYVKLLDASWGQMTPFISKGSSFVKTLALGSVALYSIVKQSGLPKLDEDELDLPSLAAGLPHFSTGIMRCWGRDTFIALRGLILIPGRYEDAKKLVLGFASCVRHGLIPNLLGEGKICRYNCRDAIWWWLQCIQDICEMCEDGYGFLNLPVGRIYPTDNEGPVLPPQSQQPLFDVIQDCLQRHVHGIHFRERGAGIGIDQNMADNGFNVEAGIDLSTGFVYGGNSDNCGTWMDKMGESLKANTKGVPATPRDGSAVELVGLCKSAVNWLQKVNNLGKYPYDGVFVKGRNTSKLSWCEWNNKIQENFESAFFVSESRESPLIHKRNIYMDSVGASQPWCDYQLRPNFPIAMVVAPELFDVQHAWKALDVAQSKLLGPLGMKTLDPDDMIYRGDYNNADDSDDRTIAKGFNYHQGPEWLWPVGYFLRAKLHFANELGIETLKQTIDFIQGYLSTHHIHLENSLWKGLPELTNSNGSWCRDSCEIQAWSNATILEVMYDVEKYIKQI
uniref:glycogen debranching enzyme-like n=1 Tax=Styela clava TaxID=7725 RepID=UPI00193A6F32|nr:glycogen debranching enzyme-like [Styela clava]